MQISPTRNPKYNKDHGAPGPDGLNGIEGTESCLLQFPRIAPQSPDVRLTGGDRSTPVHDDHATTPAKKPGSNITLQNLFIII